MYCSLPPIGSACKDYFLRPSVLVPEGAFMLMVEKVLVRSVFFNLAVAFGSLAGYIVVMDIELSYEERGEGDVLILLHGNGEDHTSFSSQIEHFCTRFRVIAVDSRGHGLSPRGEMAFTLSQFADDLYEFMREKGIGKASILGFSDGGNVALLFALKHPDMVDRLVLNGANLFPEGLKSSVRRAIEDEYRAALDAGDERMVFLMKLMIDEPHIKREELHALDMPVLVIAGTDDMILRSHTKLIARSIRKSSLVFVEGDHFIAYRNADAFNKAVDNFFDNN